MGISSPFYYLFGRSPIKPLQQHMAKVVTCAERLLPFMESVIKKNWEKAQILQGEITALENEADEMKKDLKLHLPSSLFLPIPRSDVLLILAAQDRIANKAQDIAGLIIGRKMIIPTQILKEYYEFLQKSVEASQQAQKAINELDELLETGFRGNEVKLMSEMILRLDEIERDTDQRQVHLRAELFHLEKKIPPIECMFLYKLIERTGDLADSAQTVGGQLQLLLAK